MIKLIGVIILSLFLTTSDISNPETKEETPITIEEVYKDSGPILNASHMKNYNVEKLLCDISDNAYSDKELNKIKLSINEKYIKVTGKIYKVHNDYVDGCWISFHQQRKEKISDGWVVICCYFNNAKQAKKVSKYKSGDTITIVGYCKSLFMDMNDCFVVE